MPPQKLEQTLAAAFGSCATLTDQSDGWVRLVLTGARAYDTLERLSMVNLHPAHFAPGKAFGRCLSISMWIVMRDKPNAAMTLRVYHADAAMSSAEDLHGTPCL